MGQFSEVLGYRFSVPMYGIDILWFQTEMSMWVALENKNKQRIAVGPGNAHFISIRQVSSDAATLQRGGCGHCCMARRCCWCCCVKAI